MPTTWSTSPLTILWWRNHKSMLIETYRMQAWRTLDSLYVLDSEERRAEHQPTETVGSRPHGPPETTRGSKPSSALTPSHFLCKLGA